MQDERRAESSSAALLPRGELRKREKERDVSVVARGPARLLGLSGHTRWICGKRTG